MGKPIVRTLVEIHDSRAPLRICRNCGTNIHMMCRKETGICSEICEKQDTIKKETSDAPNA